MDDKQMKLDLNAAIRMITIEEFNALASAAFGNRLVSSTDEGLVETLRNLIARYDAHKKYVERSKPVVEPRPFPRPTLTTTPVPTFTVDGLSPSEYIKATEREENQPSIIKDDGYFKTKD